MRVIHEFGKPPSFSQANTAKLQPKFLPMGLMRSPVTYQRMCASFTPKPNDTKETIVVAVDSTPDAMGATIHQGNKLLAVYSKLLSPVQRMYSASLKQTFAIIQTLEAHRAMLLGKDITVCCDNCATCQRGNALYIKRWKRVLEDFQPTFQYTQYASKQKVPAADTLSRVQYLDDEILVYQRPRTIELSAPTNPSRRKRPAPERNRAVSRKKRKHTLTLVSRAPRIASARSPDQAGQTQRCQIQEIRYSTNPTGDPN